MKREKFSEFEVPRPQVENVLPSEPNKIIISTQPGMEDDLALGSAFRPRAYYKLDLRRGTKELLIRGKLDLVEKGLAEPDRLVMFSWSYGGYAALVAASREDQIYQCVIAGAAVADMDRQYNEYANEPFLRGWPKIEQLSCCLDAVNPVDEADKVNVPILLIHGSVDQRVQPYHAKIYRDELDDAGKFYKFVELDGADHFYNTLFYDHQLTLYTEMIDFLQSPHCFGEEEDADIRAQASASE